MHRWRNGRRTSLRCWRLTTLRVQVPLCARIAHVILTWMPYTNKEQQRRFQREWCAKRRKNWFRNKSCANCNGKTKLEVDHIDPSKKISHNVWSWSLVRRQKELAKCQVLCTDCHQKKTIKYREPPHGTRNRYTGGCGCTLCGKANTLTRRIYRATGKYPSAAEERRKLIDRVA